MWVYEPLFQFKAKTALDQVENYMNQQSVLDNGSKSAFYVEINLPDLQSWKYREKF